MQFLDTIKLGFGNNLILGNTPDKLTLDKVAEKLNRDHNLDIESFGLFDSSQPNYTTYYPDVTAEDLQPKDSEFIYPTFRALSEVIVHKNTNPVDFSQKGVLRKSMSLLAGATVNPDHESNIVGNAIGAVQNVAWQESYKTDKGIFVPAGINAKMKLDGKSNPRIARGIMMDPPSIHSTSVTVQFLWDKSHSSLTDDEFWNKLGTYDKDGQMIRRMATKVKKYPELSLVAHGADPFAQKVDKNGKIVNPTYADISYNSEQLVQVRNQRQGEKYFFFDFKADTVLNSENPTIPIVSNDDKNKLDMNELLLAFAAALGMTGDNHTKELILAEIGLKLAKITELTNSIATLTAQGTTDTAEIARLKLLETELTAFKAANPTAEEVTRLKAFETTQLTAARTRLSTIYNKVTLNKPDAAIVAMIANADLSACAALEQQYSVQLQQLYPDKCGKCGSTNITRASSVVGKEKEEPVEKTMTEAGQILLSRKRKASSLPLNPGSDK